MAVFYLDTSALVKRYKTEEGSDIIDYLYDNLPRGHSQATSFLTVLEFEKVVFVCDDDELMKAGRRENLEVINPRNEVDKLKLKEMLR